MPRITIDNQTIEVPENSTILQAAERLGIRIPTMCFREGFEPSTSCMVCVVRVEGVPSLVPSCAMRVSEGMAVHTNTPDVVEARRSALELLLSDHVGDCEGPCRLGCPAQMDIPQMLRWIAAGELKKAIRVIKRDIPIPAVLGRVCPAPCEKVCRSNGPKNAAPTNQAGLPSEPIAICLLKRFAADADLASPEPFRPAIEPTSGKKVAIVGAGPCGLSAAYYLAQKGHACTIFDKETRPGGLLRSDPVSRKVLPPEVLDREVDQVLSLGVEFVPGRRLGENLGLDELGRDFDAVFLAVGDPQHHGIMDCMPYQKDHIPVERGTFRTAVKGVFAGGGAIAPRRMAVKSVADGKQAARVIDLYLAGEPLTEAGKEFNSKLGELSDEEWLQFAGWMEPQSRVEPDGLREGFNDAQARREAARCLHCDCRKKKNCKLRGLAAEFAPAQTAYKGRRRPYTRQSGASSVIYESGKCISCGLCIQVLSGRPQAVTFAGRGFTMNLSGPLGRPIVNLSEQQARECIRVCPTGAWALVGETKTIKLSD